MERTHGEERNRPPGVLLWFQYLSGPMLLPWVIWFSAFLFVPSMISPGTALPAGVEIDLDVVRWVAPIVLVLATVGSAWFGWKVWRWQAAGYLQ